MPPPSKYRPKDKPKEKPKEKPKDKAKLNMEAKPTSSAPSDEGKVTKTGTGKDESQDLTSTTQLI